MVYAGNAAAGASSTAATIAGGIADRSAYWTNALIDTRTGTPVAPLVPNIWFHLCWDGTRLDSPDHRSHVTCPAGQLCPPDRPVAIPHNCVRKAATCESHMLGDGRVIDGKGDL